MVPPFNTTYLRCKRKEGANQFVQLDSKRTVCKGFRRSRILVTLAVPLQGENTAGSNIWNRHREKTKEFPLGYDSLEENISS